MNPAIFSQSAEELILLYHQVNKELTTHLLDGGSWDEQQQRISTLNEISKELTKRKIEIDNQNEIPGGWEKIVQDK